MRNTFLLLVLLLGLDTTAQNNMLTGRLVDEHSAPLAFANVSLVRTGKASLPLSSVLTDSTGRFSLPSPAAGIYLLRFSLIGFAQAQTDSFAVSEAGLSKNFNTITLKTEAGNLENIDITANRPSIVQLPDRMVVNVQGTAMAAGNTAFGMLAKAPGIFIDPEGSIQLNGRSGVTVMIDGRLTYMSARDLRNLLESTPAENIKSIELITNPSARYDAEGTAGIVNIVFKKNILQGINGSISTAYNTNGKQHGYSTNATVNHRSGRWNSFLITDFSRRVNGREATFTRVFYAQNRTTYFNQTAEGNGYNIGPPTLRMGTDFTLSQNHSIGAIGSYSSGKQRSDFLTNTYIGNDPKLPTQYVDADNFNTNSVSTLITNLHYMGKLDTMGTTLSADVDFARIRNRGKGNYFNRFLQLATGTLTQDNLYTFTPNGFDIRSGKIDFSYVVNKAHKLEAGGRASRVTSDNDSRFYFNNNGLVLDPLRTNHFYYTENIYAAYLNWIGTLNKKWSVQAGLRAEQTVSRGESFTTGQVNDRKYLDLFPSLFVQHTPSETYGFTFSYSRRLTRPNYGNLNPFRAYRDPYTWVEGNPFLRPQYTHSFSLSQTFKKLYVLQLFYQRTTDVMVELPILDVENATTIYTTGNVDDSYSGGLLAVAPLKLGKRWDTRNTGQLSYSKFNTQTANGPVVNEQLFYYLQSAHTVLLPKDFRAEVTLLYRGPAASGLYRTAAMHRIDLAFSKAFSKKKFEVALNVNDITKGWRFLWTTNIGGNVNEFDQYLRWRTLSLSFRYNFSKGQKVNIRQRGSVDEINRAQ